MKNEIEQFWRMEIVDMVTTYKRSGFRSNIESSKHVFELFGVRSLGTLLPYLPYILSYIVARGDTNRYSSNTTRFLIEH